MCVYVSSGHVCLHLPKYCELNPIERNWCHAKKVFGQYVNGSIVRLQEVIPMSLDAVPVDMMNKFFRTCRGYEMAYRSGCSGKDVEIREKSTNHRTVFSSRWYPSCKTHMYCVSSANIKAMEDNLH